MYLKYYSSLLFSETPDIKVYQTVILMLVCYETYKHKKIVKLGVCVNFVEKSLTKNDQIRRAQWRKLHIRMIQNL